MNVTCLWCRSPAGGALSYVLSAMTVCCPSIHPFAVITSSWGGQCSWNNPSCLWQKSRLHTGWITVYHINSYSHFRYSNLPNMHILRLWWEARVLDGNHARLIFVISSITYSTNTFLVHLWLYIQGHVFANNQHVQYIQVYGIACPGAVFVKPVTLSTLSWASSRSSGLKHELNLLTLAPVPRLWVTLLSNLCLRGRKESE